MKCLDTYALVEIVRENPNFAQYLNQDFVITDLTLAEFYGVLLRDDSEELAELWFRKLEINAVPVDREILREAVRFRYEYRKVGISLFDAVGYVFSLKKGLIFVTGDKEFERFSNVEFRKK